MPYVTQMGSEARPFADPERDLIAQTLETVHAESRFPGTLLLCFMTGDAAMAYCEPMVRDPLPPIGFLFDESFSKRLEEALAINEAVHDGAILLMRASRDEAYRVQGWSYRLIAPNVAVGRAVANRGSAFNSASATSALSGIDFVCLSSRNSVTMFVDGNSFDVEGL